MAPLWSAPTSRRFHLGQTAPNPTLSTLRFFRNEYEALLQPDKFGPCDGETNQQPAAEAK